MSQLAPTEIKALARILDDLDYYQLLHLPPDASERQVKAAFHSTSRAFHPDGHRAVDTDLRQAVETIAKRVTEAYSVLRDARRRRAYDRHLEQGRGVRMQLAEARAEAERHRVETREGRTREGRQYFTLAQADLRREDFEGAARNLQTALTFEPDNAVFRQALADARARLRRTPGGGRV